MGSFAGCSDKNTEVHVDESQHRTNAPAFVGLWDAPDYILRQTQDERVFATWKDSFALSYLF